MVQWHRITFDNVFMGMYDSSGIKMSLAHKQVLGVEAEFAISNHGMARFISTAVLCCWVSRTGKFLCCLLAPGTTSQDACLASFFACAYYN